MPCTVQQVGPVVCTPVGYDVDGIDAVRATLAAGDGTRTEDQPIKIKLVAYPVYVVTTSSLQKDTGINLLNFSLSFVEIKV